MGPFNVRIDGPDLVIDANERGEVRVKLAFVPDLIMFIQAVINEAPASPELDGNK